MMIRRAITIAAAAVSALYVGGCYVPAPPGADDELASPSLPANRWRNVDGGETLHGALGNITSFASDAVELRVMPASNASGSTSVQIDALGPRQEWWVMTRLSIRGQLSRDELVPGAIWRFDRAASGGSATGVAPFFVSVLGCSGPARGRYTYDGTADAVEVRVTEGPEAGTRRMEFTATWNRANASAGPQTVTGSFVYDPV